MNQPPARPPSADEVVFSPSEKQYPREPQIIAGKRTAAEYDLVALDLKTVADAAQVYADFSKKEVRVPRGLIARELMSAHGKTKAAAGHVVAGFGSRLSFDGVEIVSLGDKVVVFRAGKTFQEQMAAMIPAAATTDEVTAARATMSNDRFWELIEAARRRGRGDCLETATALTASLRRLHAVEIFGFHIRFHERLAETYRWDLWAVAYIVNGGASDDGFEYFRAWLIAQGRAYFEAALKNPERAADGAGLTQQNECEQLLHASMEAYQAATKRLPPLFDLGSAGGPAGNKWTEEQLPKLFPNLVKKFR